MNQVNILLHGYLLRSEAMPSEFHGELVYVLSKVHQLIKGMLDVCLLKKLYRNIISVIALSQCVLWERSHTPC